MDEVEYGLEDWGLFEVVVDALAAQTNQRGKFEVVVKFFGVFVDDELSDIKCVYCKFIVEVYFDCNLDMM